MGEAIQKQKSRPHKIFISHSSRDADFVQALVELLEFLGLHEDSVICTSVEGYGIPVNENIFDYLRKQFEDYDLFVIFVHSHNFYSSYVCLNEMGAAWVLKANYCSILAKGFGYNELSGVVDKSRISIKVDENVASMRLNELKDILVSTFSLLQPSPSIWEKRRNKFLSTVNELETTSEIPLNNDIDEELKRSQLKEFQEREILKQKADIALYMTKEDHSKRFVDVVNNGLAEAKNVKIDIMSMADNLYITPNDLLYPLILANGGKRSFKIRLFMGCPHSIDLRIHWEDNFSKVNVRDVTLDF